MLNRLTARFRKFVIMHKKTNMPLPYRFWTEKEAEFYRNHIVAICEEGHEHAISHLFYVRKI